MRQTRSTSTWEYSPTEHTWEIATCITRFPQSDAIIWVNGDRYDVSYGGDTILVRGVESEVGYLAASMLAALWDVTKEEIPCPT
jgi:hypothetical protein